MNALITGGAGFIGSHLAEALVKDGFIVTLVDDLSTGSLDNIKSLLKLGDIKFVRESVRNSVAMTSLVDHSDIIFHLAAAVGVQLIVDRPVHTIETNIHGSEVILNLASRFGRRIFVASSSEVYGKGTKIPFSEDDDVILGSTRFTRWSYACSKMIDEFLALAYHDTFGLEAIVGRFFNTIGPRQIGSYGMVVPRFIKSALNGDNIEIYGDGQQSRCFCDVSDVVSALLKLIRCDDAVGEVINIGSDIPVSINELADLVIDITHSKSKKVYLTYEEAYGRPFDDMLIRVPDLKKIKGLINYEPQYKLKETLRGIVESEQIN